MWPVEVVPCVGHCRVVPVLEHAGVSSCPHVLWRLASHVVYNGVHVDPRVIKWSVTRKYLLSYFSSPPYIPREILITTNGGTSVAKCGDYGKSAKPSKTGDHSRDDKNTQKEAAALAFVKLLRHPQFKYLQLNYHVLKW